MTSVLCSPITDSASALITDGERVIAGAGDNPDGRRCGGRQLTLGVPYLRRTATYNPGARSSAGPTVAQALSLLENGR